MATLIFIKNDTAETHCAETIERAQNNSDLANRVLIGNIEVLSFEGEKEARAFLKEECNRRIDGEKDCLDFFEIHSCLRTIEDWESLSGIDS